MIRTVYYDNAGKITSTTVTIRYCSSEGTLDHLLGVQIFKRLGKYLEDHVPYTINDDAGEVGYLHEIAQVTAETLQAQFTAKMDELCKLRYNLNLLKEAGYSFNHP